MKEKLEALLSNVKSSTLNHKGIEGELAKLIKQSTLEKNPTLRTKLQEFNARVHSGLISHKAMEPEIEALIQLATTEKKQPGKENPNA